MIIKKWFIISLLSMIPGTLVAQRNDSLSYKKNKLYYRLQIEGGIGYGDLNVDKVPDNPGGLAYCLSANVMRNHNFLKIERTYYRYLGIPIYGVDNGPLNHAVTYNFLIGRQLPIGPKGSFGIATGISQVYITYRSDSYGPSSTYQLNSVTTIGVPIEITYMHAVGNFEAFNATYGINLNNKAIEGVVTLGISFGKVREKLPHDEKL